MSDWGRPGGCPEVDPSGQPCVLDAGHAGNHLTAAEAPRPTTSYLVQGISIVVLLLIAWQVVASFQLAGSPLVPIWIACAAISGAVAWLRGGNPIAWFAAGAIAGPLGLVLTLYEFRKPVAR